MAGFSHINDAGEAQMVDVLGKEVSRRRAVAKAKVFVQDDTLAQIKANQVVKGDVLAVARVAGIQGAKRTSELIPLCHPLMLGSISIDFELLKDCVEITASAETLERTGVEMEALTACSVAALTIYDMCKSLDRSISIGELCLWEKTGGKSGDFQRK